MLSLVEKPFAGDDDDEFGDRMGNKVMSVKDRDDCIGCEACARICAKKCYTHAPAGVIQRAGHQGAGEWRCTRT